MNSTHGNEAHDIRIWLLGGFQVQVGARTIAESEWRRRKAKNLIKMLALAHDHRLHREQIWDLLWPDLAPESAANSLHQVLHFARGVLHSKGAQVRHFLRLRDDFLCLCPEELLWVDVDAFEMAATKARRTQDRADYERALELYCGELLPADPYADWANNRRQKLRQEYLDLLVESAHLLANHQDYAAAKESLQRALAADPSYEEAHAGLMYLYALTGQRQQALRQYELLTAALWKELEVQPEPHNQQLYEEILSGRFIADMGSRVNAVSNPPPTKRAFSSASLSSAHHHNLPVPSTRLVGRQKEKGEVARLQASTLLLTLTGPGGSGKSRLALEVGVERQTSGIFPDGVWWVDLAPLSDPSLVPQAVASALKVRESSDEPLMETLRTYLQTQNLLLILDNCEHLITACAKFVDLVLKNCPEVRILTTSREPLRIPGEVIWLVPSMALPDLRQSHSHEQLVQYEALQLFIERATAILPTFTVNQYNAHAVAQICQQLDGLPLAIELAAARVKMLTVAQIASRLQDSFHLLTGGNRLALTRQQTLRATLDWSYELLLESERRLFHRLAVFAGGFTLEAVEGVGSGAGIDPSEILDLLSQLVNKSLVIVREERPGRRYGLLETVRQYCAEKLQACGEESRVRTRHQKWYLVLAQQAEPELFGPNQALWLGRLEPELDNLRQALVWKSDAEPECWLGLRLARALFWFWYPGRYLSEGRAWFERALAETPASSLSWMRAMTLYGGGIMAMYQGDFRTASERLEESISIWQVLDRQEEGSGDLSIRKELAMALLGLGTVRLNQGDNISARTLLEECVAIFQQLGQESLYAIALMHIGDAAFGQGDWVAARAQYEKCLTIQRNLSYQWGIAQALNNLGEVARCQADYETAALLYGESLELFRVLDSAADCARSLHNCGYVSLALGVASRSKELFVQSLQLFRERGNGRGIIECLAGFAAIAVVQRDLQRAAKLFSAVEVHFEANGGAMWPADRHEYERYLKILQEALSQKDFAAAWVEGRMLSLEQAIELIEINGEIREK